MSDREIQRLERAIAADPSDGVTLEKLAATRTRAGIGWSGESLPSDLTCSPKERSVYIWTRQGLGIEMVLVSHQDCAPDFWIGRYPVTWGEWRHQPGRKVLSHIIAHEAIDHPVTNVTHTEALNFCEWSGLRLPIKSEWTRSAKGSGVMPCLRCTGIMHGMRSHAVAWMIDPNSCSCRGTLVVPRPYPWGNEEPTPERSVYHHCNECHGRRWNAHQENDGNPPQQIPCDACVFYPRTRPVRNPEGYPSRRLGASPYGAMDMFGHVVEIIDDGSCLGTGFDGLIRPSDELYRADDIGFRVAL